MNDNFMYSLRQYPDKNFSANLKTRLDEQNPDLAPRAALTRTRLSLGFLMVLVLVIATMVVAVPGVRAKLQDLIIYIGDQRFLVNSEYPHADGNETTIQPVFIPIDQAAENGVILPGYIPEGYILEKNRYEFYETADLSEGQGNWATVKWVGPEDVIRMDVFDGDNGILVGTEALEEVSLKGMYPAAIIKGGWHYDTRTWDPTYPYYSLSFSKDGQVILFHGIDPQTLILMAESLYP